jgi:hypothetical protein
MHRLKRFIERPSDQRRLLLKGWLVVATIRMALWIAPLDCVLRFALRFLRHAKRPAKVEPILWCVTTGARYVPRATCLTQALAAHALLVGSGHSSHIQIGVAKDATNQFEAHAWLNCNGHIVLGGPEVSRYTLILALK